MYHAISNLSSNPSSLVRRDTWVLELENLELDLAMMLAVEMPDQLLVVVEVALARLTALRAVARVLN
jgi:hypothetical protein